MSLKAKGEVAPVDIHDILSNERRQMLISILQDEEELVTARDLSERIAELETGDTPPPRNIRQSVYVSLHQTHLPKLESLGFIEYDEGTKEVRLTDKAEEFEPYTKSERTESLSIAELFAISSILGLLLVLGSMNGIPVIGAIDPPVWALLTLGLIGVIATYQTLQARTSSR